MKVTEYLRNTKKTLFSFELLPPLKGKSIESLAYTNINYGNYIDDKVLCENLENLIEEIQSFVRMNRYDDLVIKVSNEGGSLMIR